MATPARAYDLSIFENRDTRVRVVKNPKQKPKAKSGSGLKKALCVVAVALLMAGFIYSKVKLSETTQELSAAKAEIKVLESEHTRLDMLLAGSVSLRNVEEFAVGELGLIKLTKQNTIYITTVQENKGEVVEEKSSLTQKIQKAFSDFASFIGL